jgi:hypothetical protein
MLQELLAALLALTCLTGAAGALWHLDAEARALAVRAHAAAARFAPLLEAAGGMPDHALVARWQQQADHLEQMGASRESTRSTLAARRDQLERERRRCRSQAALRGLAGDGPFDPGPEPDPPGPNWLHPTWQAWDVRRQACAALNRELAAIDGELPGLGAGIDALAAGAAAGSRQAEELRGRIDAARTVLDDPALRRELALAVTGPDAARGALLLVHLPVAGLLLLLGLRALLRLALMRGWTGWLILHSGADRAR